MKHNGSQIPNPKKPWFKKCMAQTHYDENVVAVGANSGMEVKHKCCEKCGERVWAPEHCPETAYLVVCILCGGLFILGLLIAMYGSGDILILGYGLLIVGPVFYFQGLKDIRPARENKKAWVTWAKERGYKVNAEKT